MNTKDGLVNLKDLIKECSRIKALFPKSLGLNIIGKGIMFYSNDNHSYNTITINSISGTNIIKTSFNNGSITISIDKRYLNKRSLNSIINRLKKIKG